MTSRTIEVDKPVASLTLLAILSVSLVLQHEYDLKQALLFLTGIMLGIALFHAAFGFTGGWRRMIVKRRSVDVRAQLILLMLSCALFIPLIAGLFPDVKAGSALAPVGISVLVGAFLFGIGMQLGGGCGSGTLFTVGQGQIDMLITICFFIVGATLGSLHLPWWLALPAIGKVSLIDSLGWMFALLVQLTVLIALYFLVRQLEFSRYQNVQGFYRKSIKVNWIDQLIHGPWPVLWGALGLSIFGLVTLILAGYPWSITFAFGLWGAKLWAALGGDVANWAYWSSGYPAKALNQSVLADITTVMNFGIILGAMLASALAGKYAPQDKLKMKRVMAAVVGGLLLGYGARLAFGCNIGALLGGIASGSLHGWLWLVAAFIGSMAGVKIRFMTGMDQPEGNSS